MIPPNDGIRSDATIDDEMQIEKNAGLVMATNNSSIVSKRSVEKLYLPEPHFFRYFVKKPVRRAPTINRGYWLRMRAIDWVVQQFLEKPSEQRKVVINLGCGYDPLPFQWHARDPALCSNTKFIDVDYEVLMETKRKILRETPRMSSMLHSFDPDATIGDKSILVDSEEYAAIGCDLRNLRRLERLLREVVDIESCLVLCVAEVSITYMQTDAADALIAWSSAISPDVTFCLLEQCSPDQPDNPFTTTMMKHFAKLGTPLRSVLEYPGQHAQTQRFKSAGFTDVDYQNLWELWSDARFLSPSQRVALDLVEPFDEWEEFALFASHYCLIVAHNRDEPVLADRSRSRRDSSASMSSEISARTSSPHKPAAEWFAFRYSKEPGDLCQRHHATSYTILDQEAVAVHGGVGPRSRLSTTAVARPRDLKDEPPVVPPPDIGARCCHTITPLLDGKTNLLVGGRASPTQVFKDCWLQTGDTWRRIHDLPQPRYRHRTCAITLPDNTSGALCYGGKTDHCNVANDVLLWEPTKGWSVLRTTGCPVPRFAPIFMRLGYNHGLLFGGMRQDGVVCQGLWRWRLNIRNGVLANLSFRATTAMDASAGTLPWFARFGASFSMQRDEVLIIGGVGKGGCIPKPYEIMSIIGCFANYKDTEHELPLRIGCVNPFRPSDCPRPFLIGHSTHITRSSLSITMGGGATCFSFGNYFNTGIWILYDREMGMSTDWIIVPSRFATLATNEAENKPKSLTHGQIQSQNVERSSIRTEEDFHNAAKWSIPRILDDLDFGPCVKKWSIAYLREYIAATRSVVMHESQARSMNFQRKDFAYRSVTFHQFLDQLSDRSSHLYLRSLAADSPSSSPANLRNDWPEIAEDFQIPPSLRVVADNLHSSPLRISNDINMWLHYDVMANVLCQVAGLKKLALFPPTDLVKLGFPPGSTTSEMNLFNRAGAENEFDMQFPRGTSPYIAILQPGDALFIPPLWAHTGISLPKDDANTCGLTGQVSKKQSRYGPLPATNGPSPSNGDPQEASSPQPHNPFLNIAVNVFFRNLPSSAYAAGRDVYGNRDLGCYEEGRKALERLVTKFKDSKQQAESSDSSGVLLDWVPKDVRQAYLLRLAKELEQEAGML